jgi:thiamine biosynthesis lipoprotein
MQPTPVRAAPDVVRTFRSMASDVTFRVVGPSPSSAQALDRAEAVFVRVASSCTRFDSTSALMRANARPRAWHTVPDELFAAIRAAAEAYVLTDGVFDPRVLEVLQSWGYDRSLPFRSGPVSVSASETKSTSRAPGRRRWRPRFDEARSAVRIGPVPIDLGGIGKGLAVRWAAEALTGAGRAVLVEAGGDLHAAGAGPDGTGWLVSVEDPRGGPDPVVVLRLVDQACATSSVRVRHWQVDGRDVHHIIDPRTGQPGDGGLQAVTVVDPDPAQAEVWSKTLFLAGRGRVRSLADEHGLAALLVDSDGEVGLSAAMRPHVVWQASRGW